MTSAAMLGIALSVGASGVLLTESEASAAVDLRSASVSSKALRSLPQTSASALSVEEVFGERQLERNSALYHRVEEGESLWQIAQRHSVGIQEIKAANRLAPEAPIQVGQVLKVPTEPAQASQAAPGKKSSAVLLSQAAADGQFSDSQATVALQPAPAPSAQLSESPADLASPEPISNLNQPVAAPVLSETAPEQADSLRSAGLMTQAEGFKQELETAARLESASAEQPVVPPMVPDEAAQLPVVTALAPSMPQRDYRVQAGETLASIAKSLGVTPEQLAHVNQIADPNFILAGQTLTVPEAPWGGAEAPSVPVVIAASPEIQAAGGAVGGTKLSRLQSTVENQVDASEMLARLRGEQLEAAKVAAQSEMPSETPAASETEATESADTYTAALLEQVDFARERAEADAVPVSQPVALSRAAAVAEGTAVNPEFQGRLEVPAEAIEAAPDAQLLAAAPLGAEAYAPPASQPSAGQMVSPDMPMLPASDEYLPEAPEYFNGYAWPTRGTLTSGYGWRWGRMHRGVDIAGPVGTPIMAAAPGVIERAGWNSGGYGNLVEIRHADGSLTRYAHNSRLLVRAGQAVSQGQQIAEMGSTGYSTGPHLHFEIHMPNQGTVNPMAYLPQQ
ncbi:MAG: peptidoglycan DD-metalloendopeptidase family protein [Leptolyngbya sp. SIO4C1]|nr:peptidoglycan DD-metalloendopeptidase family protein [Leptolyngbya sp. SIO4C1]